MKTLLRLSMALLALLGIVCSKKDGEPGASQPQRQAAMANHKTYDNSSDVEQRVRDEMQRRGISRDAAIGQLIRIGITRAAPDANDPLGILTSDDEFIEAGIQRYMKQYNVSRTEAGQRLLRVAAATDPVNPLGLGSPNGAKR